MGTVQYWVRHAGKERLNRVDFSSASAQKQVPVNKTDAKIEEMILKLRQELRDHSDLGEHGAVAIHETLEALYPPPIPSIRTIGRILDRHGILDANRRIRRTPPPKGWYLPLLASKQAEVDSFDLITDLVIKGGDHVTVLTGISLHGGLPASWPEERISAKTVIEKLHQHWREHGLPDYAKFDNDPIFQGTHRWTNSFGRVIRFCLQLGVTPIFAPPREPGFQAEIESFNGYWQKRVWGRFIHQNRAEVREHSDRFIRALYKRNKNRIDAAPKRRPFPDDFEFNSKRPLDGSVIFLRRANQQSVVQCLGMAWELNKKWANRLVRMEANFDRREICFHALRRRDPTWQPLLLRTNYEAPQRPFTGRDF